MKDKQSSQESDLSGLSTHAVNTPPGVMKLPADEIVDTLIRENPPGHVGSIIRHIQFYINRSGKKIDPEIKEQAELAKRIFQGIHTKKKINV